MSRDRENWDLRLLEGEEIHEDVVLRGILRAKEKVRICTANLKNFTIGRGGRRRSIVSELRGQAGAGVRTEILHGAVPSEPFLREILDGEPFPSGSLEMKFCPRVHAKLVIIDYGILYMGTANFTGAGMGGRHVDSRNFELGIITDSETALDGAMAFFDGIWSGRACPSCLRKKHCPDPLETTSF